MEGYYFGKFINYSLLSFFCTNIFYKNSQLFAYDCWDWSIYFYIILFFKSTNYKYFSISSLLLSALVSAIIILILGSLQTLVIGFDITNNLNHIIFKLYSILCLFVTYTLIAKLKEYNKKKIK